MINLLVGYGHVRLFNFDGFVVAQVEFRQHLKRGLEFDGLARSKFQSIYMRLRDRPVPALDHGFTEILRHQVLHHVTGDLAGKAVPHHAGRDFALAESRDAGLLGILLHQRFLVLGHHVGGDFYARSRACRPGPWAEAPEDACGRARHDRDRAWPSSACASVVWACFHLAAAQKQGSQDCLLRCALLRYPSDFLISADVLLMLKRHRKMGISGTYPKQSV